MYGASDYATKEDKGDYTEHGVVGVGPANIEVIRDGKKTKAETDPFGKYITFDAEGSDVAFCVEKEGIPGGIAGKIGILLAAAGALAVLLHGIMKKKRRRI